MEGGFGVKRYIKRLLEEKFSPKFIMASFLLRTGISLPFKFKSHGILLRMHPSSITLGIWRGRYSIEADKVIIDKLIREDFICFDVGANIGHLSILMAKKANNGLVFSIEPQPKVFAYLLDNIQINNIENIIPINIAISEDNGITEFYSFNYADDQSAIVIDKQWKFKMVKILSLRLDSLLKILKLNKIDFLKVDVEGAELLILKSLGEYISKVRYIWFEFIEENYRKFNYNGQQLLDFLDKHRFSVYMLSENGSLYNIKDFQNLKNYSGNLLAVNNEE
jgi:FkbM family methyltransferase